MTKALVLVRRRLGLDPGTFHREWESHGAEFADRPGIGGYVQSRTLAGGYRRGDPPFDGAVEVWFNSTDPTQIVADILASPLLDPGATLAMVVDDVTVTDGPRPADAVKCIALVHRSALHDRVAFHRHWTEVHGPIGGSIPGQLAYVQSHAREPIVTADGRLLEGCAITWYESTATIRASLETDEYRATRADEPNFVHGDAPVLLTTERILRDPGPNPGGAQ